MRCAVCSRNSDYFLLCFTSTGSADLFHSCGAQITHWPISSKTLSVVADDITQATIHQFWPERPRLDIRKKKNLHKGNSSTLGQASQNICKASILGGFTKAWLDRVMPDLIYRW